MRVPANPSDALVILVFSKWFITMTTTSVLSFTKKHGKVKSPVLKNSCNWFRPIHKPIFEVACWDHVVHKGNCARSIGRRTIRVSLVGWKNNKFLWKLLRSISKGGTDQDIVSKAFEFASSVHSSILGPKKRIIRHWWYVFEPKNCGSILVHDARCLLFAYTMCLLCPCRIRRDFWFDEYSSVN